jgi:hypothetical protein
VVDDGRQPKKEVIMPKTVSSIYNSVDRIVPFNPNVEYRRFNEGRIISDLVQDAMFMKVNLHVTYEQAVRWLDGRADRFDRRECEDALAKLLSNGESKVRNRLRAICSRYSLAA